MAEDLKTLLTPELFKLMVAHWAPWSRTEPLDFGDIIHKIWFSNFAASLVEPCREKSLAALTALSRLGLDNVPDMMSFLPPPSDPDFPELALGLQLVLDQAPRAFLSGVDVRYTYEYFAAISTAYALQLQALPAALRPSEWERWRAAGVSLDYFVWVRVFWGGPWVHNEKMGKESLAFTNATREFVESLSGRKDPYRERPEVRSDLYGFPKMLAGKAPDSPCDFVDGCFFMGYFVSCHLVGFVMENGECRLTPSELSDGRTLSPAGEIRAVPLLE